MEPRPSAPSVPAPSLPGQRRRRRPEEVQDWLRTRPSLAAVRQAYPAEWAAVQREVAGLARSDAAAVAASLAALARPVADTPGRRRSQRDLISAQVRRYLTVEALNQANLAATTGVTSGTVRMGLIGGFLAQRLLFSHDLERKPVAAGFRGIWPLLPGRHRLMPLVRPQGIYCFYARSLIRALAAEIGDRPAVEIAAGDGTLSRFLAAEGVSITATDDRSWQDTIDYPDDVLPLSAGQALRRYRPAVVLCSWPPAGNTFERQVFALPEVQEYLVVTTRQELNAGSWSDYRSASASAFTLTEDHRLGRGVLPPELNGVVLIFRRR